MKSLEHCAPLSALDVNGKRFVNFPRPLPFGAYESAASEFVAYYDRVPGVVSIHRFGSISFPGLSDLDFIVVLADDYRNSPEARFDIAGFSSDTQYVLYHPQLLLPETLLSSLHLLVPLFEFETVKGTSFERPAGG